MPSSDANPLVRPDNTVGILDGGLATELERHGANLNDALWSARLLRDDPDRILRVHRDYLEAGAEILVTSSYQASIPGFVKCGIAADEGKRLLSCSVALADQARNESFQKNDVRRPLVAVSIGPYGAYLADGSEFRGDYHISEAELRDFHRARLEVFTQPFAKGQADLLACETIPCPEEAAAILDALADFPNIRGWISFSCRSAAEVSQGDRFDECVSLVESHEQVLAVGLNCTAPRFAESLVELAKTRTDKPIVCYPNLGETWDDQTRQWVGEPGMDFGAAAERWAEAGASWIGGCCRTTPELIRKLAVQFSRRD